MNNVTAIVPIRSGSQRVKHKNMYKINGQPLYTYIIQTLKNCRTINRIVINTDYGLLREVYHQDESIDFVDRDEGLRGNCDINLVIKSTLNNFEGEHFLQTHVTNPLLSQKTIETSMDYYCRSLEVYDSLFSVTKIQKRFWSATAEPINHAIGDEPTTQNLEPFFEENSCLYLFSRTSFFKQNTRIGLKPKMYEIPKNESWDIDDEDDMQIVSKFMS